MHPMGAGSGSIYNWVLLRNWKYLFTWYLWSCTANESTSENNRHASVTMSSSSRGSDEGPPPDVAGQRYDSTRLCTSDAAAARAPGGLLEPRLCAHRRLKTAPAHNGGGAGSGSIYNWVLLSNLKIFIYMVPVEFPSKQAQFQK